LNEMEGKAPNISNRMRSCVIWIMAVGCKLAGTVSAVSGEELPCDCAEVVGKAGDGATIGHVCGLVPCEGKLYLIGGWEQRPVYVYDSEADSWRQGGKMPMALHHFQGVVLDGEIWIAGALTGEPGKEFPVDSMWIYNPAKDTWRSGPSIPQGRRRGGAGCAVYGRKLFLLGGINPDPAGAALPWFDCYDVEKGEWIALPDAPFLVDPEGITSVTDQLGFSADSTSSRKVEKVLVTPDKTVDAYDLATGVWRRLLMKDCWMEARSVAGMATTGAEIRLLGEGDSSTDATAEEAFHTLTRKWTPMPKLLDRPGRTWVALTGDRIIVLSSASNRSRDSDSEGIERIQFIQSVP
jgi:hypothetical protein